MGDFNRPIFEEKTIIMCNKNIKIRSILLDDFVFQARLKHAMKNKTSTWSYVIVYKKIGDSK